METGGPSSARSGRSVQANVRVALLLLSTIGFLAIAAGMEVFRITDETLEYQTTLERSAGERTQIRRVLSMLHEAETSQRGFLLTRREDYLRRFNEIRQEIQGALDRLSSLFGEEPVQESRARGLEELTVALMRPLSDMLASDSLAESWFSGRSDRVIEHAQVDAALRTKLQINPLIDEMLAYEDQAIRLASLGLSERIRFSGIVMIVLLVSIVVLVTGIVGLGLAYLTNRGRVEMELREATRLAREASEAKTQFLAAMSHEIRTPLTGILGYAELLQDEALTNRQQDYVARLQVAGVGLSTLVNEILDFSKVEAGEIEIVEAPFPPGTLIANCLSITSVTAQKKQVELRSEIDPALQGLLFQRFSQLDWSAQREYGGTGPRTGDLQEPRRADGRRDRHGE